MCVNGHGRKPSTGGNMRKPSKNRNKTAPQDACLIDRRLLNLRHSLEAYIFYEHPLGSVEIELKFLWWFDACFFGGSTPAVDGDISGILFERVETFKRLTVTEEELEQFRELIQGWKLFRTNPGDFRFKRAHGIRLTD